ncbi:MAG: efflux RND transporter periplasmic adaptor subunit [Deltaproteobacteria bacterium]|nr:efflux RND transporter periplasmic adaptor subunit [Deltaproteobacteria bacterium]
MAAIIVALVAAATVQGLKPKPPPAAEVATAVAKKGSVTRTVTAAGHLQAVLTVKVSSNITGDLVSLAVAEGEQVKKGQILGQIDRRVFEARVQQSRAGVLSAKAQVDQTTTNIEKLQRDLDRLQKLVDQNLASAADLDAAKTALEIEKGRLAGYKQIVLQNQGQLEASLFDLSRTAIIAPMAGTILELDKKVGERIRGSDFSEDVILLMGGMDAVEVKAEVGEHEVVAIHEGDEAMVDIDAIPDQQFKGHVSNVAMNAQIKNPGTDAEITTFFVRVGLDKPPPGARPGMSTAVSIATATRENVITVPIQAITSREAKKKEEKAALEGQMRAGNDEKGKPGEAPTTASTGKPKQVKVVFVVKDGKVEMREVKTGIASRTDVEILEGINEGEQVVEGPYRVLARELQDGQAVKVQEKEGQGKGGDKKGPQGGRS